MKIIGDLHTHTIFSKHAYNTLSDNIRIAKKKRLRALAITDHGIGTEDSPTLSYFENLSSLPRKVGRLVLLRGVEANIMDETGVLDMPENVLNMLDIVIASFHSSVTRDLTIEEATNAYLEVAKNPLVNVIGHCGSPQFKFDYERVIPEFKKNGKVVEINAHTFVCREKSISNCLEIAELCKKYQVPILINSDAHHEFELCKWKKAVKMLKEIKFPENLIINAKWERLKNYLISIGVHDI